LTRNPKPRAGSSIANNEKREITQQIPLSKGTTLQKARTMEQTQLPIKRPSSFRGAVHQVKAPKKEEVTNKIIVDIHTLKGGKSREKKSNIEEIISNEAKRETPFRSQEIETPQETNETKEIPLKQSQGQQKNQNIWAEIENLDHQIQE